MLDLIIYLSSHHLKDLFGTSWFSVEDFCHKMGYNRTNLQRKLTEEQLTAMFGSRTPPKYVVAGTAGKSVTHPIETVFEAAIYKLGLENLYYPVAGEDGRTYNPQNEMFRLLGTKRSFSQNETFFFSHPYPPTLPFSA